MLPYRDIDGDSGVMAYEPGSDYIRVQFKGGATYLYTDGSAGSHNIEQMKRLAANGNGLNAFINTHVMKRYLRKER